MQTRWCGRWFAAAAAVVLVAPAWAGELSADEKRWLKQCVEGLKSKSDRVRQGAETAIATLGAEAIEPVVPLLFVLDPKDDDDWEAAGRALQSLGAKDTAWALEVARTQWPKPLEARLVALVTALKDGTIKARQTAAPAAAAAGQSAPESKEADGQVTSILAEFEGANRLSSDDPRIRRIAALGRAAVGPLLRYMQNNSHSMAISAAAYALDRVVTEDDIPAVGAALLAGAEDAGSCLKKFRTDAARDALLDAVAHGVIGHRVLEGLEPHRRDEKVHAALVAWLGKQGTVADWTVGAVANFLADGGAASAVPALKPLLAAEGDGRWQVAKAVVRLGVKEGFPVLIEILAAPVEGFDQYGRHSAGEALNDLSGQHLYTGRFRGGPDGVAGANWDEAVKQFRDWWAANSAKAKYDPATKRWTFV